MTIQLRIVHQWFLDADELSSLLVGTPGRVSETAFCPRFTDCSESLLPLDEEESLLHPGLRPLLAAWGEAGRSGPQSTSGDGIDRRIVSISIEAREEV